MQKDHHIRSLQYCYGHAMEHLLAPLLSSPSFASQRLIFLSSYVPSLLYYKHFGMHIISIEGLDGMEVQPDRLFL